MLFELKYIKDPIFLLSEETEAVMESTEDKFKYIFKTSGKEKLPNLDLIQMYLQQ